MGSSYSASKRARKTSFYSRRIEKIEPYQIWRWILSFVGNNADYPNQMETVYFCAAGCRLGLTIYGNHLSFCLHPLRRWSKVLSVLADNDRFIAFKNRCCVKSLFPLWIDNFKRQAVPIFVLAADIFSLLSNNNREKAGMLRQHINYKQCKAINLQIVFCIF